MTMDTDISPLELGLQKRLEKLQPKTKKPDFLRSLIERQAVRIDSALSQGYSYDEIASIFSEQGKNFILPCIYTDICQRGIP